MCSWHFHLRQDTLGELWTIQPEISSNLAQPNYGHSDRGGLRKLLDGEQLSALTIFGITDLDH